MCDGDPLREVARIGEQRSHRRQQAIALKLERRELGLGLDELDVRVVPSIEIAADHLPVVLVLRVGEIPLCFGDCSTEGTLQGAQGVLRGLAPARRHRTMSP
jgi:hypothetical protein